MNVAWEVMPEKTEEYWLQLRESEGWFEAVVKWDGCIHLHKAANVPFDDESGHSNGPRAKEACDDYIHICDIDEMIALLVALKAHAVAHFGAHWPNL